MQADWRKKKGRRERRKTIGLDFTHVYFIKMQKLKVSKKTKSGFAPVLQTYRKSYLRIPIVPPHR